jgi:hypothetical protein
MDGGTQPRASIDRELVNEYADAIAEGAALPPPVVFYDGEVYWLADGFHRVHAHKALERAEIECDVRQGTKRDAILFSLGANSTHGQRRSNDDKRRAVLMMLNDREWSKLSDREIAQHCKVDHKTVAARRPKPKVSGEIPQMQRRTVTRNGSTYTMDTAAIGKKPAQPEPSNELVLFDQTVQALSRTLSSGEFSLKEIPEFVKTVLGENRWNKPMWRERVIKTGELVRFERFEDFVTTPPLEGLGADMATLRRICEADKKARDMLDAAAPPTPADRGTKIIDAIATLIDETKHFEDGKLLFKVVDHKYQPPFRAFAVKAKLRRWLKEFAEGLRERERREEELEARIRAHERELRSGELRSASRG